ncbi:protein of unknown function DUF292 [Macleaya cordata]|uniref:Vacuolar protein sorting-associated protein Ist1 n=1 Tax=Macleaya cordata TaxID=56857 RepID=A0A200Q3G8_MACCD|nr:protein of unknown function DUF292 [Macleaya cordata]
MGKKLDALLGRTFKTSKFKALVNLAISRLAVLKNQRQVRCSQARSDVTQLLNLGHQDRALLRVEVVIKEQNMLDVFVMIEGYCYLLLERLVLIENNKVCPDELDEAISGLIFAASRCGEFPELQEMRDVFTSRYGKEFAARAVELKNNCGVNRKIILKLSTRQPSLESRMKVLKEIASENGIALHLEEETLVINKDDLDELNQKQNQPEPYRPTANLDDARLGDETHDLIQEMDPNEQFSGSQRARKYRDVASAAQAAFESAAYAAAAARAAVELSRSESYDKGFDDDDQSNHSPHHRRNRSNEIEPSRSRFGNTASPKVGSDSGKIQPIDNYSSESEVEEQAENHGKYQAEQDFKGSRNKADLQRPLSASISDPDEGTLKETRMHSGALNQRRPLEEIAFDESDEETLNEFPETRQNTTVTNSEEKVRVQRLNLERKPISMRTRRGHGR